MKVASFIDWEKSCLQLSNKVSAETCDLLEMNVLSLNDEILQKVNTAHDVRKK